MSAKFKLDTLDPIDAMLSIPGSDGGWTLVATTKQSLRLEQTAPLLGGDQNALKSSVDTVGSTGGFTLERLEISFKPASDPSQFVLSRLVIAASVTSWTVPHQNWFRVKGISARLLVLNPTRADSVITGELCAILALGSVEAGVLASFDRDAVWKLRLAARAVNLAGLSDLSDLVSEPTIKGDDNLPAELPTSGGFRMGAFGFSYDSRNEYFPEIAFALQSELGWTIVPDVLELGGIDIAIEVKQTSKNAKPEVSGHVSGSLTLAGVPIRLSADKPKLGGPWTLTGRLEREVKIDFNTVLREQVAPDYSIPAGYLPTSLSIRAAEVTLVPSTRELEFTGAAMIEWPFNLGAAPFQVKSLGGAIRRAVGPGGMQTSGELYGTIALSNSLEGDATVALGTAGIDTVVQVTLRSTADSSQFRVGAVAESLSGTGANAPAAFAALVPAALPTELTGVAVSINLTKRVYLATGTLKNFGWAYFLYQGADAPRPPGGGGTGPAAGAATATGGSGYLFAAGLGDNFKFENLLSGLKGVDEVISVKEAMLAVYAAPGGALETLKQAVRPFENRSAPIRWPLPEESPLGTDLPRERGFVLTAAIDMRPEKNRDNLFEKVLRIGTLGASDVRLLALVNRDAPDQSVYSVSLHDITILQNMITLTGVVATFRPAKKAELTLAVAILVEKIFDNNYRFQGELKLTSTNMIGRISLLATGTQKVTEPFKLPNITIDRLELGVERTFGARVNGQVTDPATRFALWGKVLLGAPPATGAQDQRPAFEAKLALAQGKPALFSVALTSNLDVGALLAQCFTGDARNWPADFINIVFLNGSRVYYFSEVEGSEAWKTEPAVGNVPAVTYKPGFNVDAHIVLKLVEDIPLHFTLESVPGAEGKPGGVKATVAPETPINLLFIELASVRLEGDKYVGGPTLQFATNPKTFGFTTGVNFFGKGLLAADVGITRNAANDDTVVNGWIQPALQPDFGNLSFKFTYTRKADGSSSFSISDWPSFDVAQKIIEIAALIQTAAGSKVGCEALAELVDKALFKTKYSVTPSAKMVGDKLEFSLTVSCSMSIGDDPAFLKCDLPEIKVQIPKNTGFSELLNKFIDGIRQAGPDFVQDLLRSPDKIALFLAMMYKDEALGIALKLVCRSRVNAGVAAAAGAAAKAFADAIAAGLAFTAAIGAATGVIASTLASQGDQQGSDQKPGKPTMRSFSFHGATFQGGWTAAGGAAKYEFKVAGPQFDPPPAPAVAALGSSVPANLATLAGTYSGSVRGVRGADNGDWSVPLTLTLETLATPIVRLSYDGTADLLAEWTPLVGGPYTYELRLFRDGAQLTPQDRTAQTPGSQRWPLANLAAGSYTVQLAVKGGDGTRLPGAWSGPSNTVVKLAPPVVQSLSYANDRVTASWTAEPIASAFEAQLVVDGGTGAAATPASLSGLSAQFDSAPLAVATYRAQARATAATFPAISKTTAAPSDWSAPSTRSIAKLPPTDVWSVGVDPYEERIGALLRDVPGADLLLARLHVEGADPGPAGGAEPPTRSVGLQIPATWQIGPARVEGRAARSDGSAIASKWTAKTLVRVHAPVPGAISFDHNTGTARLTFFLVPPPPTNLSDLPSRPILPTAPPAAPPQRYLVRFFVGTPARPFERISEFGDSTDMGPMSVSINVVDLPAGPVLARTCTVSDGPELVRSVWLDVAPALTKLGMAAVVQANYGIQAGVIGVTLQQAEGPVSEYQAQLIAINRGPVGPVGRSSSPVVSIDLPELEAGAYTLRAANLDSSRGDRWRLDRMAPRDTLQRAAAAHEPGPGVGPFAASARRCGGDLRLRRGGPSGATGSKRRADWRFGRTLCGAGGCAPADDESTSAGTPGGGRHRRARAVRRKPSVHDFRRLGEVALHPCEPGTGHRLERSI